MKMSKVGNQTNSQDPQAVNSRVFVGNLNTFQCSKTDVERMFQRYGRIAGISMHKGYAFVQFTNPFDARSACLGEDGRTVLGQVLDVNMVAEPKPHQTGRKRQNVAKTGNDWDYYYDSYYASTAFPPGPPRLVPPLKRPRLMVPPARAVLKAAAAPPPAQKPGVQPTAFAQLKTYSNPDILICGNCREMFTELQELLDHKKTYCKLRFTCKCHTLNGIKTKTSAAGEQLHAALLLCVLCKDSFVSAWDLMVHVQAAHMMNIYELGMPQAGSAAAAATVGRGRPQPAAAVAPGPLPASAAASADGAVRLSPDLVSPPGRAELAGKQDRKKESLEDGEEDDADEDEDLVEDADETATGLELEPVDGLLAAAAAAAAVGSPSAAAVAAAVAIAGKEEPGAAANGTDTEHDKELEELLAVESTAQACIMHALHLEQGGGPADLVPPSLTNGDLSAQE